MLQKEKHSNKNKIYSCTPCIDACGKTPAPPNIKLPSGSSDCPYGHLDIHTHISAEGYELPLQATLGTTIQ
jgi:hypothetical protein